MGQKSRLVGWLVLQLIALTSAAKIWKLGGAKLHMPDTRQKLDSQSPSLIEVKAQAEAMTSTAASMETEVSRQAFSCITVTGRQGYSSTAKCPRGYTLVGGGASQRRRSYDYWSQPVAVYPRKNDFYSFVGWGSMAFARCCQIPRHICHTKTKYVGWSGTIDCAPGYTATGGGVSMRFWSRWWMWRWWWGWHLPVLRESTPAGERRWRVRGEAGHVRAYATCCSTRAFKCSTVSRGRGNYLQMNCPSGTIVTGGGWKITYPWRNRYSAFEDSKPRGNTAWVVDSGYGYGWTYGYARCCTPLSDKNLCAPNNGHGSCDKLTTCSYKVGSYTKVTCGPCPAGYTGNGATGCKDIDECRVNNGGCDEMTKCINTKGSYKCTPCPPGYQGKGETGCKDIDECEKNNGGCDKLTRCTNLPGSYQCSFCPVGYFNETGKTGCDDINECKKKNGGCDKLTTCKNTVGSYKCSDCPDGYHGNGKDKGGCKDLDECVYNNGGCDKLSNCTNTRGSRLCSTCPKGYTGDGYKGCDDVDECKKKNGGCHEKRICVNLPGSHKCGNCKLGWKAKGAKECIDMNECAINNGGCDVLVQCFNTDGGRTCGRCPKGYMGTGTAGCTDYDECKEFNGGCHKLTVCTNTPGSRICGECPYGYQGNGYKGCQNVKELPNWGAETPEKLARAAAKKSIGLSLEKIQQQDVEQAADQKKRDAIKRRADAIEHADGDLAKLRVKLLQDKKNSDERRIKLRNQEADAIIAHGREVMQGIIVRHALGDIGTDSATPEGEDSQDEAVSDNNRVATTKP